MAESNSFQQYLMKNYGDRYREVLSQILRENPHIALQNLKDSMDRVEEWEIDSFEFKGVSIDSKGEDKILFDLTTVANILYTKFDYKLKESVQKMTHSWMTVTCSAKIGDELTDLKIKNIYQYDQYAQKRPLNGDLIPVIGADEYEKYAREILKKYYPEALANPKKFDISKLPGKMGLRIQYVCLSPDKSIFGRIVIDETVVKLYDYDPETGLFEPKEEKIPGNTILIDINTALDVYGSENITVAHECVHFFLHKKAVKFAKMYNKDFELVDYVSKERMSEAQKWMEIQANGIAPFLALPKEVFKTKAARVVKTYVTDDLSDRDRLFGMKRAILALAELFGVTKHSIKRRLLADGYREAHGIFNYIDGKCIPPYSFKRGSLEEDETFCISFKDLVKLHGNGSLTMATLDKDFVFVENHLVINKEKYIESVNGELQLTDYGRTHAHECCLKFIVRAKKKSSNNISLAYLNRDINKDLAYDIRVSGNTSTLKDDKFPSKMKKFQKDKKEVLSAIRDMDFKEALNYLFDFMDLSPKEVAIDSGLSDNTIRRYLRGEAKPDKKAFVALCLALQITGQIVDCLRSKIDVNFKPNDEYDDCLLTSIHTLFAYSPSQVNEYFESLGYEPLT